MPCKTALHYVLRPRRSMLPATLGLHHFLPFLPYAAHNAYVLLLGEMVVAYAPFAVFAHVRCQFVAHLASHFRHLLPVGRSLRAAGARAARAYLANLPYRIIVHVAYAPVAPYACVPCRLVAQLAHVLLPAAAVNAAVSYGHIAYLCNKINIDACCHSAAAYCLSLPFCSASNPNTSA